MARLDKQTYVQQKKSNFRKNSVFGGNSGASKSHQLFSSCDDDHDECPVFVVFDFDPTDFFMLPCFFVLCVWFTLPLPKTL